MCVLGEGGGSTNMATVVVEKPKTCHSGDSVQEGGDEG